MAGGGAVRVASAVPVGTRSAVGVGVSSVGTPVAVPVAMAVAVRLAVTVGEGSGVGVVVGVGVGVSVGVGVGVAAAAAPGQKPPYRLNGPPVSAPASAWPNVYRELFGWELRKWDGPVDCWLVMTGDPAMPGIDGGLVRRVGGPPAEGQAVNAFVCTVDVADVDASVAKAESLGGTVALPKQPVPGVGWLAYVKDTDGNILGLMRADTSAG